MLREGWRKIWGGVKRLNEKAEPTIKTIVKKGKKGWK